MYVLWQEEHEALPHGLELHIPSKVTRKSMNIEFESFNQNILLDISTIPEEYIARIKTSTIDMWRTLQCQNSFSISTSN